MSSGTLLRDVLFIPVHHQKNISTHRIICLVHDEWLQGLRENCVCDSQKTKELGRDDASLLLAPSHKTYPPGWTRVCIKVIHKNKQLVAKLHNGPFYNTQPHNTCIEHLTQTSRENYRNLWLSAYVKYGTEEMDTSKTAVDEFTNVVRTYLNNLHPDVYCITPELLQDKDQFHLSHGGNPIGNNVVQTLAVIESRTVFFIVQPYIPHSLWDLVSYSPAVFEMSYAKSLFILYQILQAMAAFHSVGLPIGEINLHNVRIDQKLWITCVAPQISNILWSKKNSKRSLNSTDESTVFAVKKDQDIEAVANSNIAIASNDRIKRASNNAIALNEEVLEIRKNIRLSVSEHFLDDAVVVMCKFNYLELEMDNITKLTEDWVHHRINTFRYLMYINYLAGRRLGDPNNHPILPWVMDFTSTNSGFRDLTMSKFRLNKGDSQLDFTYEAMREMGGNSDHIPHHVSDVLSDITYFVYKARRTPKHLLCTYVRSKWVPNEYPQSIERMYKWTPDECIPEFFTDPTIFQSIHEDLPDLDVPSWCISAAEFIEKHMSVLECEQVSGNLHHWIDLTFGYKLSGPSAVKSKNVYLQLVDGHMHIMNHGVVQLFNHPHPQRLPLDKVMSPFPVWLKSETVTAFGGAVAVDRVPSQSEADLIKLPMDFDPTAALDCIEALHAFTSNATKSLPPSASSKKKRNVKYSDIYNNVKVVWMDMQQFGCLMCELYLAPKMVCQNPGASIAERYKMIGQLWMEDKNSLPRIIYGAADMLLNLDNFTEINSSLSDGDKLLFEYQIVNSVGLQPPTPSILLQPFSNVIPFPHYFEPLYSTLNEIKHIDSEIAGELNNISKSHMERENVAKFLSRKKVKVFEKYLQKNSGSITEEGYELLLPYLKELFADTKTSVQAAWSLVSLIGKEIGSKAFALHFLPYLTKLFSAEESLTKHLKLYHRSFLVQLLLNIGLEAFLTHFCTLLVEAIAGYKNFFVTEDTIESLEDIEAEVNETDFCENEDEFEALIEMQEDDTDLVEAMEGNVIDTEDIRPDQNEDDAYAAVEDDDNIIDTDILEEFPNLTMDSHSISGDSGSIDMLSQRSIESDVNQDEVLPDKTSIHSISHIVGIASQMSTTVANKSSYVPDAKAKNNASVHFQMDRTDSIFSTQSAESDLIMNYSKNKKTNEEEADTKTSFSMKRSETEEFKQIHISQTNICDTAAESVKWLSHRLGPLLTAKYLSKNLVRMLALCYFGDEQVVVLSDNYETLPKSTRIIQGDRNAHKVLECLSYVACLYGEQVILLQYIPCIIDLIHIAKKHLTVRAEAGLVAAIVLLRHVMPLLSDKTFHEVLKESVISEAMKPMLKLVSSMHVSFPSGSTIRNIILFKLVDALYITGLRLGFEMTRRLMTGILQQFFMPFEHVYSSKSVEGLTRNESSDSVLIGSMKESGSVSSDSYLNIKIDFNTRQYMIGSPVHLGISPCIMDSVRKCRSTKSSYSLADIQVSEERDFVDEVDNGQLATEEFLASEIWQTFSSELALAAYIPLTSVFGSHHMEEHLHIDDVIRKLWLQYDKEHHSSNVNAWNGQKVSDDEIPNCEDNTGDIGSNVQIMGNRICLATDNNVQHPETFHIQQHFQSKGILKIDPEETRSGDLEHNKHRHLKGNWLAYWEHELGLNEKDTLFNFKQIKLQTFRGHTNSIRCIRSLDSENSFISASKDKTVKLWSLNNFGDGTGKCRCQWSYEQHKKSVFSVAYLESMRLIASCDSTVHIWDPYTGKTVRQLDSPRFSPVIALTAIPSPSTVVVTATQDCTLKFLDLRTKRYAQEYKCSMTSSGLIKCIAISPDRSWVAVGFHNGYISVLNLYTGIFLGSWKAHDNEILQLKAFNRTLLLSTSFDVQMKLWNIEQKIDTIERCILRGHTEPVHCVDFYRNQIVSATTNNKIGVHTSGDSQATFSSTKLRSEVFKGVLTSMVILPLNRMLLLGADNGLIRLLC